MQKLNFSIIIDSPKQKVWNAMLEDKTYRVWTEAFTAGSHYVGDWNKGSKILFLATNDKGTMSGMVSRIKENKQYEYISIEHLGVVENGIEDTSSDAVKVWAGLLENYTFKSVGNKTELIVDLDSNDEYKEMFQNIWPKALQKLRALAEKT